MFTVLRNLGLFFGLALHVACATHSVKAMASQETKLDAELPDFSLTRSFHLNDFQFVKSKRDISIMWWNIDCATQAKALSKTPSYTSDLEKNLILLSQSKFKPDLLILGEYCPYYLNDEFEKNLQKKYQYKHHLVRNIPKFKTSNGRVNERNGILVLSDLKLNLERQEILFASAKPNSSDIKNRVYLLLSITHNKNKIFVNPVHIYNPWRTLLNQRGVFGTLDAISNGDKNPNAIQGQQILDLNTAYVSSKEKLLSIGDFNSPKSFYIVDGYTYSLMHENYKSLVSETTATFHEQGYDLMSAAIDHAFGQNIQTTYNRVLPFSGSGHKPLFLIIH